MSMRTDAKNSLFYKGMVKGIREETRIRFIAQWMAEIHRCGNKYQAAKSFHEKWGGFFPAALDTIDYSKDTIENVFCAATWKFLEGIGEIDFELFCCLMDESYDAESEAQQDVMDEVEHILMTQASPE